MKVERKDGEASPLQSKKFWAFLVAEATWKLVILVVLFAHWGDMKALVAGVLLGTVIIAGFIEALYIGGQAALDKYVRVAEIAASVGQTIKMKGVETVQNGPPKPPDEDAG